MTIKDAADKYGISKQAIYQRLKRNGITVDTLTDKETGELTPDAEAVFENLFGESSQQVNQRKSTLTDELKAAQATISSQQREIDLLTVKLEAVERERDLLRDTLDQERAMFTRYLPAPGQTVQPGEKRPGLFRRLAAAVKG